MRCCDVKSRREEYSCFQLQGVPKSLPDPLLLASVDRARDMGHPVISCCAGDLSSSARSPSPRTSASTTREQVRYSDVTAAVSYSVVLLVMYSVFRN